MPRLHSTVWLGCGMLVFAALLTVFFIPTWVITPQNVQILVLSPDFWPYIIAGMLAIGGIAMLLQYAYLRSKGDTDEPYEAVPGGTLRITLIAVLMAVYFWIMPYLGMVFSSVIAYVAFVAIIGFPRKTSAIVSAIVLPLLLYAFFNHAAGVPIPQADFFRLP